MFPPYVFLAGACFPLVSASIYPTQPVQATVWLADQPMLVSWTEDWKYPQLSNMGPVDISLWCDTDMYLVSLASGVDPTTKTRQVTVPGSVLKQGFKYTLRFAARKPIEMVIYSADFTIIPANTTTGSNTGAGAGTGTGSGGAALATQSGMGSGTSTTAAGSSSWTTTTMGMTTLPTGQPTTSSGVPPPSGTPGSGVPGRGQRPTNAGRRGIDVEKLKFQFVFVIWPVLMGITMAL